MNLEALYIKTLFTAATEKRRARIRATLYASGCNVRAATINVDAPCTAAGMHDAHKRAAAAVLRRAHVNFASLTMENVCLRSRRFTAA
jgi:hypothetical protein